MVEQREVKIGQRGVPLELDVPTTSHLSGTTARNHDREVGVVMHVRIAHTASKKVGRVVQQGAVAIGRLPEPLEKIGEQRNLIRIDLRQLGQLDRVIHVMRHRMMWLGNSDLRIGPGTGLSGQLERDHSGQVSLQGEHLQIEHQLDVLFPRLGYARRPIELGERGLSGVLLGPLDTTLHFANRVEILVDFGPVASYGPVMATERTAG